MASSIKFTAPAQSDLAVIIDYISRDSPGAARRVYVEIRARCETLSETPKIGVETSPGVRRLVVGAYLVFYRLHRRGGASEIQILRVIHGARQIPRNLGG